MLKEVFPSDARIRPARPPPDRWTHSGHRALAKKPNYDFEKRKKEQDRKKKKDAKREERLQRNRAEDTPEATEAAPPAEGTE
jgi:hypothetical protein